MPHGGKLVDLFADDKAAAKAGVSHTIELTDRQSCDVQLLCNGGFSPLTGFMSESEYDSVVDNMRLTNNLIFGLPVVMDTDDDSIKEGSKILLTYKGTDMAVLDEQLEHARKKLRGEKGALVTASLLVDDEASTLTALSTWRDDGAFAAVAATPEYGAAIAELVAHFRDADGVPASVDVGHYAYDGGGAPE